MESRARAVRRVPSREESALKFLPRVHVSFCPRLAEAPKSATRRAVAAVPSSLLCLLAALGPAASPPTQRPARMPAAAGHAARDDRPIHYLGKAYDEPPPLSLVDPILTDNGVQGARLGIADNNKSGQFLGQQFELVEDIVPADGDVTAKAKEMLRPRPRHRRRRSRGEGSAGRRRSPRGQGRPSSSISATATTRCAKSNAASMSSISRRATPCAPTRSRNISFGRNGPLVHPQRHRSLRPGI